MIERIKYPRTYHLPWSPGRQSDDKVLTSIDHFNGKRVVVTIKMDGENFTCYSDGYVHARSIDSSGGIDRDWVKTFLTQNVCFNLPSGWRVCGENLWAKHSISYENLDSFFMGFSIWDDQNRCLSWDDTLDYFESLSIVPVKVIYNGIFDADKIQSLSRSVLNLEKDEGYVMRIADGFDYESFPKSVAKYVRPNHVQTDKHWRHSKLVQNVLR